MAIRSKNHRTVASYELCAHDYAHSVGSQPSSLGAQVLLSFINAVALPARVLEIGSGPGFDADFLESHGLSVRRTDAAQAFVDYQSERGKHADKLDLIHDELGGPYHAIVAQYVLQHIDRDLIDLVLGKVARALMPGGWFLATLREGQGEQNEVGSSGGYYYVALWQADEFARRLANAGLQIQWVKAMADEDGKWMAVLARR
jgi:SAM-dependent methyltransferase